MKMLFIYRFFVTRSKYVFIQNLQCMKGGQVIK